MLLLIFFFKQKTAYEMRISDWSSDVCSSDLCRPGSHRCCTIPRPFHRPPHAVLTGIHRVCPFMALQPEPEPVEVPLVYNQLVPGPELDVRLDREHIYIRLAVTHQRQRVLQRDRKSTRLNSRH